MFVHVSVCTSSVGLACYIVLVNSINISVKHCDSHERIIHIKILIANGEVAFLSTHV